MKAVHLEDGNIDVDLLVDPDQVLDLVEQPSSSHGVSKTDLCLVDVQQQDHSSGGVNDVLSEECDSWDASSLVACDRTPTTPCLPPLPPLELRPPDSTQLITSTPNCDALLSHQWPLSLHCPKTCTSCPFPTSPS